MKSYISRIRKTDAIEILHHKSYYYLPTLSRNLVEKIQNFRRNPHFEKRVSNDYVSVETIKRTTAFI